jgi:hypothetical protein
VRADEHRTEPAECVEIATFRFANFHKKIASGTLFPEAVLDALASTRGIRVKICLVILSHHPADSAR